MSKSVRLRTQLGKDQSLTFDLNQDFEFIEILSLKLSQTEIYTRTCADYGVVVGRISINNGFGVPNAKLSIFVPITPEDEFNPVISAIYPYKSPEEINEDGFKYNLLPYKPSYPGHSATGSFPDLEDVLTNSTAVEIFDKYYKFTVTTNDSGDFMLFGVPTGSQNLVMNVDLSDIGPFSQSPQDLIRLGLATDSQVDGVTFKTSENLFTLPQIVSVTQQVTVNPLWGDEDLCQISITRADLDLTQTKNIEIKPTAIFMGSIFSDSDRGAIKKNCKPPIRSGNMCGLGAGPGQILAIRQTIKQDSEGRPVLEQFKLENNGNVIDENGTWLLDVPMNLDYIITNEFGEQVFSNDEKKGIPTRGKYRFKVKWNQSPDLSLPIRRANFLVPNIKEYGWLQDNNDPIEYSVNASNYKLLKASYAFSLDWNDYGLTGNTIGESMIQEAIDCKDRFFDMSYNKVYTISQLITRFTKGFLNRRYSGIKNITDDECESTSNRFPTNDAQYKPDLLFVFFSFTIIFISIIFRRIVLYLHVFCRFFEIILNLLEKIDRAPRPVPSMSGPINAVKGILKTLSGFNLPLYTFPDCELCSCKPEGESADAVSLGIPPTQQQSPFRNNSVLADLISAEQYAPDATNGSTDFTEVLQPMFAGFQSSNISRGFTFRTPGILQFTKEEAFDPEATRTDFYFSMTTPLHERINLQNAKSKFFGSGLNRNKIEPIYEGVLNSSTNISNANNLYYLGGGTTQIKVAFNTQLNPPNQNWDFVYNGSTQKYEPTPLLNTTVYNNNNPNTLGYHYDNIFVLLTENQYEKGSLLTFDNPFSYNDVNLSGTVSNQFGTSSVTGTSLNNGNTFINVSHTHPITGKRLVTRYQISGDSTQNQFLRFPTGIEYFQVVESISVGEYMLRYNNAWDVDMQQLSFKNRVFSPWSQIGYLGVTPPANISQICWNWGYWNGWDAYQDQSNVYITIMMRGVDPHSTSQPMKIGLGRFFGKLNHWDETIEGNFKLNIPLQPNDGKDFGELPNNSSQQQAADLANRCTRHGSISNSNSGVDSSYTGGRLFYKSYHFRPSQQQWTPFNSANVYNYINTNELSDEVNIFDGFTSSLSSTETSSYGLHQAASSYVARAGGNGRGLRITSGNYYTFASNPTPYPCGGIFQGSINGNELGENSQPRYQYSYQKAECVEGVPFMGLVGSPGLDDGLPTFPRNLFRAIRLQSVYYSKKYNNTSFTMSNSERIVMRSDRLPTSDVYQNFGTNSMGGMANGNFALYEVPIDGVVTSGETQPPQPTFQVQEPEPIEEGDVPNKIGELLATFSCGSLVPIECYQPDPPDSVQLASSATCLFTTYERNGEIKRTQFFVEGSCYSLVRPPYLQAQNLLNDYGLITEWVTRMNINFGACREVFSHLFVNNWINGSLYMLPFKTSRFFTGPNDNPPNQPYNKQCDQTVYLHPETFNFYYRSAPYKGNNNGTGQFLGREGNFVLGNPQGNTKNHMYPTTMMDLGPRDELQKFLSQSGNWDGYIMNRLDSTTFGDTSDLLNIFILSRLVNTSFTNVFKLRGASVLSFFNERKKRFVDADFAQMLATNSQFGIAAYDPENYPEPPPEDNLYSSSLFLRTDYANKDDVVFGIFYDGDSQARDYISPNRTVFNEDADIGDPCAIQTIPVSTQTVPFYLWEIRQNAISNIFGKQSNDWKWDDFSYGYQLLDRLTPYTDSKIFQPGPSINQIKYHKGWIYNVELGLNNPYTNQLDFDAEPGFPNSYLMGAPYYFYFGLVKGASAFDRFSAKWIEGE